jgi:hypothetical protein
MRRIVGVLLCLGVLACGAAGTASSRAWSIVARPTEPGAYYGTFQSHLPTFARVDHSLYRSRTLDVDAGRAGQARADAVELRIDRLTGGQWRTVFQRTGHLNPACLAADGDTLYAVVSDQRSFALSVLAIEGENVAEFSRPAPLATASKVNCAVVDGMLLFLSTYGAAAQFSLTERRFLPDRVAFIREYAPGACTHYPHISVAGARLFVGHNSVRCADTNAGYLDMIGYIADGATGISAGAAWRQLLPETLRGRDIWIADTWLLEDRLYFAGSVSECAEGAALDLSVRENPACSAAFFGSCDGDLRCRIHRTEVGQGKSGNFVHFRGALYFFGEGLRRINVWRLQGARFALEAQIPHDVQCPYAFNFAPEFNGVVEGQVTEMGRCGDGVDRYVSFTLRPS